MKYFTAYVPQLDSWIVFAGQMVYKEGLTEEDAKNMAYLLNTATWMDKKNEEEQKKQAARHFDFESIYEVYPRKMGKKIGIKRLTDKIRTPEKFELLKQAVIYYREHCQTSGLEEKFIKHFSTWVQSWEDWIPENTLQTKLSIDDITKTIQF